MKYRIVEMRNGTFQVQDLIDVWMDTGPRHASLESAKKYLDSLTIYRVVLETD